MSTTPTHWPTAASSRARLRIAALVLLASACANPLPTQPGDDASTGSGGVDTGPVTASTVDGGSVDETGTIPAADCGDGQVDVPEECDLGGSNGTGTYCTSECRANVCGDGYVGPGEACDDGNASDADACTTACGPSTCGNGMIEGSEQCDDGESNSTTGACLPSCIAATCGDQFVQAGVEVCDSNDIAGQSCEGLGFPGGVLLCASDCLTFDMTNCWVCGDGVIQGSEGCDGADLGGQTCQTQGYGDGALARAGGCTFDVSGCALACNNDGIVDAGEQCDGTDLAGATCESQGFSGGTLGCTGSCAFEFGMCSYCGNGVIDAGEQCESGDVGAATCDGVVGAGSMGTLGCSVDCLQYDTSGCCLLADAMCVDDAQCCSSNCDDGTSVCVP